MGAGRNFSYDGKRASSVGSEISRWSASDCCHPKGIAQENQPFGFLTPVTYKTLLVWFSRLPLDFCFLMSTYFMGQDGHVI